MNGDITNSDEYRCDREMHHVGIKREEPFEILRLPSTSTERPPYQPSDILMQAEADQMHEGIDNLDLVDKKVGEVVSRGEMRFSFTVRQVLKVKKNLVRL